MTWLRQLLSFGVVGMFATVAHVAVALLLIQWAVLDKYLANLLGAMSAFAISYLGNARFTFATDRSLLSSAGRYLWVSLFSLALTTTILAFVERSGLPIYTYALVVLITVPPATFLLAKFWAFQPSGHKA